MKKRSPIAVLLLPLITFGLYSLYWNVVTKGEMNKAGANIPTAWLILIPFVNIWWLWKHSEGVGHVTEEKMSGVLAFILQFLLGFIGQAVIQSSLNKVGETAAAAPIAAPVATDTPAAPVDQSTPPATPTV